MGEESLRILYASLVEETVTAFKVDFHYAAEICAKARAIEERRLKRQQSSP